MEDRDRLTTAAIALAVALVLAAVVLAVGLGSPGGGDEASVPGGAVVTFRSPDGGVRGQLTVRVADTPDERYTGLSDTASLGPNEGMLFVHPSEGRYTYVMRDMVFPIDIVFVGADRRVTAIHHAEVEEAPLTRYQGTGKWVVETPYGWTTEHGVAVGDRVVIESLAPAGA